MLIPGVNSLKLRLYDKKLFMPGVNGIILAANTELKVQTMIRMFV